MLALLGSGAGAQTITSISLPNHVCAGSQHTLTFGHNAQYNVNIYQPTTTMSHAGQAFLPDGVPCGSMGCSYRSPVTFTDFNPNTYITSIQDIKYVRLKIEHSYIGDIYIGLTCPNGQKVSLMNWKGTGSSSCKNQVPTGCRTWSTGNNVSGGTFLGMAYDYTGSPYCDPNASGNEPGIGWNYCWSNNTTSGYSYAAGDGIIYRSSHAHNGRIDSSNVAAHTNFYHPEQAFSGLVGCPLNGEWYIEVIDAYSGDNGYIFDWELSLNPALIPVPCHLIGRDIIGTGITKINDSTYTLNVPDDISTDSSLLYTLRMLNDCGDTIDSIVSIAVHPNRDTTLFDTVCDQYQWMGEYLTRDTILYNNIYTTRHCDSTVTINLNVKNSTTYTLSDSVVENSLPYSICGTDIDNDVEDTLFHLTNAVGCDSSLHFSLHIWRNKDTVLDSTICEHQLPFQWRQLTFQDYGIQYDTLLTPHGADSVLVLRLAVKPDVTTYLVDTVVENYLPYLVANTEVWGACNDSLFVLTSQIGCDSSIYLSLFVWENVDTVLDTAVCRHQLPITWGPHTIYNVDTVNIVILNTHGADSTVWMRVAVLDDDTVTRNDTIVENSLPYSIEGGFVFTDDSDTTLLLTNSDGCDSTVHYQLRVWRNVETIYDTTVCDNVWPLVWRGYKFLGGGPARLNLHDIHGADSTVSLFVAVNPVYDTTITPEICDNGSYSLGPLTLNHTGHYEHTFATIEGCDSLVRADLSVWPTYIVEVYDTACRSTGIEVAGVRYHESGIIPQMHSSMHGCDSLVNMNLTIKGYYLKARAHISPTIVTPTRLDIEIGDNSRAAIDRLWLIGDDFSSHEEEFTYTYPEEYDTMPLYLIAYSDDGCTDTLRSLLQIDRTVILVPNAFTPTLSSNSRWFIYSRDLIDIEVWIYNRHGFLVHHYVGEDGDWDGTSDNGYECPQGAYVFKAEYHSRVYPDRLQTLTGTILLIR